MILSTCCYVKKNAGMSFDELQSVVGRTQGWDVCLTDISSLADLFFRVVPRGDIRGQAGIEPFPSVA
jgi:hypothetical protein